MSATNQQNLIDNFLGFWGEGANNIYIYIYEKLFVKDVELTKIISTNQNCHAELIF